MRALICASIHAYQRLVPQALRGRCIFGESCSNFVMRAARERGSRAAVAALSLRMRRCRPGYHRLPSSPLYADIPTPVRLVDGGIVDVSELSRRVRIELAGG
jgi:putative component of membrane protein insertase Oxa1/YidC/SpoIIIJ protein YidD